MATDLEQQLDNIYNAARVELGNDARQQLYSASQARQTAFRQLNNNANYRKAMFSGMPAATQMQYDSNNFIPNGASIVTKAVQQQATNQQNWDDYVDYIKNVNSQIAELQQNTKKLAAATAQKTNGNTGLGGYNAQYAEGAGASDNSKKD